MVKDVCLIFFFLLAEPTTVPMLGSAFPGTTLGESSRFRFNGNFSIKIFTSIKLFAFHPFPRCDSQNHSTFIIDRYRGHSRHFKGESISPCGEF